MVNMYRQMKEHQQEEVNTFPMFFAFSNEQFERGMERLGLNVGDTHLVYRIGGGGIIRRSDAEAFSAMFDRHEAERRTAIDADTTGKGYVYDMFCYELANHEYGYTGDAEPALDALGLSFSDVGENPKLLHAFKRAKKQIAENDGGF